MKLDSSFVNATDFFLEKLGNKLSKLEDKSSQQNLEILGLMNRTNSLIHKLNDMGIRFPNKETTEDFNLTTDIIQFLKSEAAIENSNKNFDSLQIISSPTKDQLDNSRRRKSPENNKSPERNSYFYHHINKRVNLDVEKQLQQAKKAAEIHQKSKYSNHESPVKNYIMQKSLQRANKTDTYYSNKKMFTYYKPSEFDDL